MVGQDASARVEGNTVIWDNRGARDLGGAWASSLEEGQLTTSTWALLAALGGAAVGAAGMSTGWLLRGSRRRAGEPEPDVAEEAALVRAPTATSTFEPPFVRPSDGVEDPSVWAPDPGDSPSA